MNHIVIIPCGSTKQNRPTKARDLYVGCYFKSNLRWALSVAPDNMIFILSAKHGLVSLNETLEPYNLKMGNNGSVSVSIVRQQAKQYGLFGLPVYGIDGKEYLSIIEQVFSEAIFPVRGKSIGVSMSILKRNHGKLPQRK